MLGDKICSAVTIPVVAIGGINLGNISKLSGLGFSGISLISAIFGQSDIKAAAMKLKEEVSKIL